MGWLRDLMAASEPKLHSYGELARRCLEHEAWPLDIQPQARSLASLYSKFDRGIEVEWLHDRPEVQVVLAQVLHLPASGLATEVKKHVVSADQQQSRWRLRDTPSARPLDLREEPLPAIFADSLLRPGLWSRLWWRDGNHQGAELLGRWLHARALAEFTVCFQWREVVEQSAIGTGPLFVLYWGPAVTERTPLHPNTRPLCIVAAGAAPSPDFTLVETPLLASQDPRLIEWLCSLLPTDTKQTPEQLSLWLRGWATEGLTLDFDTVAGLVGSANQLELETQLPLHALATKYLSLRLDLAEEAGTREAKWLRQHGLDLPVGITKNAVRAAGDLPWDIPRTKTEWLELVPDEYQRGVDADWTRVSLQRAGTPLTVAELEKALSQVPPGGFRVLSTLCDAHVFEEVADGKFTVHPRWFAQFLEAAAYSALLDETAEDWGQVGLVHHRIPALLEALNKQFTRSAFQTLDAALELDDNPSPSFVLAIELLVVATGRALLRGVEFESEQMTGLLELQSSFLLDKLTPFAAPFVAETVPLTRPRLLGVPSDAAWGEWLLCLWSLSELSERSDTAGSPYVNPWSLKPSLPKPVLALVEATLANLEAGDVRVAAIYSLLGRLLQHLERVRDEAAGTPEHAELAEVCAAPVFAVARVLRGDGWPAWQLALTIPHGVESVKGLVAPEAWQYLAKTAWRTWLEKGADESGVQLFTDTPTRRQLFWPHLPDRVLQSLLDARNPLVLLVPAECMKAEWVTMYLERVPEVRELAVQYLEVIPASAIVEEHFEVLFELLEAHALVDRMRPVFQTHPAAALARLLTLLDQGRLAPSSAWLAAVPAEHRAKVLDHIRTQVQQRGASYGAFGLCRAWLADLCARRTTGWTEVYPVLEECEQRYRRLSRAFPSSEPSLEAR
jgi:hypothetical protein